tara:strand:+ start:443 stop:922 length:480 start_codon:yes stop_codon:yes gene_type:complete
MYKLLLGLAIWAVIGMATDINRISKRAAEADMTIRTVDVDRPLQPYLMEFDRVMNDAGIDVRYGSLVVIKFLPNMRAGLLGVAWGMNHDVTVIHINPVLWAKLSHQDRRMVMFHELAHDVFNLKHWSTLLMNPVKPQLLDKAFVDNAINLLIKHIKDGR